MMVLLRIAVIAVLFVCGSFSLSARASAATLFDNNISNSPYCCGNNPMAQGFYVAQDFVLTQNSTLTGFVYNAFTTAGTVPVTQVNLNIYSNSGVGPGTLLYSGSFGSVSSAATGTDGFYTFRDFSVNLPGWTLGTGSYFLALNVLPNQFDMHWSIPNAPTLPGQSYISNSGAPGTFGFYNFDHDFRLLGSAAVATPVPAALPLFATGLAGLGWLARRRRKHATA